MTSAGTGERLVAEVGAGVAASFDVTPNEVARVIFLNYTTVNEAATAGSFDAADTGSVDAVTVDHPDGAPCRRPHRRRQRRRHITWSTDRVCPSRTCGQRRQATAPMLRNY